MILKSGKNMVRPFTNKQKARKFANKIKKMGYQPKGFKSGGVYFVMSRKKR